MIAVRSFPDELSTSPILRTKRWEWLEAVLQKSNWTSSNSRRKREATIRKTASGQSRRFTMSAWRIARHFGFVYWSARLTNGITRFSGLDDHNKSAQSLPPEG